MSHSTEPSYAPRAPLLLALSDIKIAHSVFAMPFALLAAFLASPAFHHDPTPPSGATSRFFGQLALIVLCMIFARTWAMLINRLADWRFDRDNARTARRVVASGQLTPRSAAFVAAGFAAGFCACCAGFWLFFRNPWPLILSTPVLAWIALYSFTKRFTFLCHLFLGSALAVSPIAALIAIAPELLTLLGASATRCTLLISAFVLLWVAGFDIAYAMQDIDFDRRAGLHSIPASLGPRGALLVSRALHAAAFVLLVSASRAEPRFGLIMLYAVLAVGALLIFEHIVLARRGVAGLPLAFFTLNGVVSCLLGAAGIADTLI